MTFCKPLKEVKEERKNIMKKISKILCALLVVSSMMIGVGVKSDAANVTRNAGSNYLTATMSLTRLSNGTIKNGQYYSHYRHWSLGSWAVGSKKVFWNSPNYSYNMTLDGMVMIYAAEGGAYREAITFNNYK